MSPTSTLAPAPIPDAEPTGKPPATKSRSRVALALGLMILGTVATTVRVLSFERVPSLSAARPGDGGTYRRLTKARRPRRGPFGGRASAVEPPRSIDLEGSVLVGAPSTPHRQRGLR